MYVWTSCLRILTKSPAIPQQLYKPASRGLSSIAELLVYVPAQTRAHATVANNVTVWWAELIMCGRVVMHDARPSLFIFAVLSAVLRSGFRDTPKEWCDFENRVRVRSRSLEMAPIDRSHTSFGTPPNAGPKLFLQSFQLVRVSGTGEGVWGEGSPPPQKKNSNSNYNNILFLHIIFIPVRRRL